MRVVTCDPDGCGFAIGHHDAAIVFAYPDACRSPHRRALMMPTFDGTAVSAVFREVKALLYDARPADHQTSREPPPPR